MVSAAVFPMIVGAAVWLPLLLAAIEMIIRHATSLRGAGRTLPWAVLGAAALGRQVLAGHPEITYYTLLVMAALCRLAAAGPLADGAGQRRPLRAFVRPACWLLAAVVSGAHARRRPIHPPV